MSLDLLTSSSSASDLAPPSGKRSLTWLLPTGLILGFLLIFALLFGQRLLPATQVHTAPVISLRLSSEAEAKPPAPDSDTESEGGTVADLGKGDMIFQASGWVEPDPYTIHVSALINGVVDQVHVLEGQSVKKGELLATLIDTDAQLHLQEAKVKIKTLGARITAHCVGADIAQIEINAAKKKIEALQALQADSEDNLARLEKLPTEAIPEQQVVQARLAKIRREALVAEAESVIPRLKTRIKQIDLERQSMESSLAEEKDS